MPGFHKTTFAELERRYLDGLGWLKNQGVVPENNSRLPYYAEILKELIGAVKQDSKETLEERFNEYADVLFEANDFVDIAAGLSGAADDGLKKRLQWLIGGPNRRDQEIPDDGGSIRGRNTAFELIVAARLSRSGLEPQFREAADTTITINGRKVFFECKRCRSEKKIVANFNQAIDQCHRRISQSASKFATGIAVVDFSTVANPEGKVAAFASNDVAIAALQGAAGSFAREFVPQILKAEHTKILALMVRYSGMIATEGRLISHAQQWAFVKNGNLDEATNAIADQLARQLNDNF